MRILIIEDEKKLADMLRDCLLTEKYTSDIAYNGEDGLFMGLSAIYDVIILDVMLPIKDGFKVLESLRHHGCQTPVLMLTAKSDLENKLTGLDLGADDYMTKPFEMKELLARIRVLIRRSQQEIPSETTYRDLVLLTTRSALYCTTQKQQITLGSKEFQLAEYLLRNPNQILSKNQISDKIWGYMSEVEYNNTEVYISFLRKKMNFLQSDVKIKTIRGVGYCLE